MELAPGLQPLLEHPPELVPAPVGVRVGKPRWHVGHDVVGHEREDGFDVAGVHGFEAAPGQLEVGERHPGSIPWRMLHRVHGSSARFRRVLGLAVALSLLGAGTAHATVDGPIPPLRSEGRWLTDATGRVVQLRGVNEVAKSAPYYPSAFGFGADDAAFLAQHGFNSVRLGVDFRGLMPTPGRVEYGYIENLARTVRELGRQRDLRADRLPPGRLLAEVQRQRPPRLDGDRRRAPEPARRRLPALLHAEPGDATGLRELLGEPARARAASACRSTSRRG